jgi:DNA-binding response OmpR family regulator
MENRYVLVVDDNPATCALLTALLQREFTVETAPGGTEAIEMLRTRKYAAIVLDLIMPPDDGFAVLEFLRETSPESLPRVLVVTAAVFADHLDRVKKYDVCAVITKPFEVDAVISRVRECVGSDGSAGSPFVSSGVILLLADILGR